MMMKDVASKSNLALDCLNQTRFGLIKCLSRAHQQFTGPFQRLISRSLDINLQPFEDPITYLGLSKVGNTPNF